MHRVILFRRPAAPRAAFTLVELLVVISIIAVLSGILLPMLSSVQESGRSAKCVSNLRQIGAAMNLYANDNNNCYPPVETSVSPTIINWDTTAINPYLPERPADGRQSVLFICPDASYKGDRNGDLSRTYSATECMIPPTTAPTINAWTLPVRRTAFISTSGTMVLFDAAQSTTNRYCLAETTWQDISGSTDLQANSKTSTYIDYRHRNAFHGLFADGHVDTISRTTAATTVTQTMWKGRTQ